MKKEDENTMLIKEEYVTLTQVLKFFKIISSGGEAKTFLATNFVFVNGEREIRRGKKIYPNDAIVYSDVTYRICSLKG